MARLARLRGVAAVLPLLSLLTVGYLAMPVRSALAQEPEEDSRTVGKITLLNRKAIEAYQTLNFEEAQKLLREAMDLSDTPALAQHPIRARTCISLGMVLFGGFKQRDAAIKLFRQALQIAPDIRLSRGLANPQIQEIFDEAVKDLASDVPKPPTAPLAEVPTERLLAHEPIKSSIRGRAVAIEVLLDKSTARDNVVLGFRAAGAALFSEMKLVHQEGDAFTGIIPAVATAGGQVEYYVEARRMDGKRLASRGSSVDPIVVVLSSPLEEPAVVASVADAKPEKTEKRFLISLLAGTGLGWTTGVGEVRQVQVTPSGFAWASLAHIAPEIGYFVSPHLLLAVQGRFQLVSRAAEFRPSGPPEPGVCGGDGVCSPAKAAFAGFLKGAWYFRESTSAFRPYVSASVGGGYIRHVAQAGNKTDCGPTQNAKCLDTVAGGPFLAGAGVGFSYQLAPSVAIVFVLDAIAGAPHTTFQGDGNLGVAFRL